MWDARVCVACLATDVKMYSMSANSLLQPYQLLAGVQFDADNEYLPQKLCWECAALVNKFNLFRHKCERAYLLLQDIYNQHDELLEQHVKETVRERHHLSSQLSIIHIPNYTLTSRSVTIIQDTSSTEQLIYSVKPEFENLKVEYSMKSEPVFNSSDHFMNCDETGSISMDDNEQEGIVNEMINSNSEEDLKLVVIVTEEEARPLPCFSGEKAAITPDAWTEIILTQEQVYQLYTERKNSSNYKKAALKCQLCYQVFNRSKYYTNHMLKHQPSSGSYECDFCKLRYKTRKSLTSHVYTHIRKYKCNICNTGFMSRKVIKYHIQKHEKLGPVLRPKKSSRRPQEKRKTKLKKRAGKMKRKVKKKQIGRRAKEFEAVECVLTQEEMMEVVRKRQLAKGYDAAPFKCHLCYKVFLENRTYSQHMTLHDPMCGKFECDICKIRLRTHLQVWSHISKNHIHKYTCNICSNVSYNRGVAKNHYKKHEGLRFICHVCAATFRKEAVLQEHVHKKHPALNKTSVVCRECGTSFPTFKGLILHKHKMHQVATLPEENAPYCDDCKVQFASTKAWTKHVLNSDRHKDLQKNIVNGCIHCGDTFNTNSALLRHKKEQHPSKANARNPQPCALCGERMMSAQQQRAHYRRCHPEKSYSHVMSARYTCEQCGKHLYAKTLLDQHRMMHSGPPPLQCSLCPKAFYMEQIFKQHLLVTHSDHRPYQCDACGMSFKIKPALKRHLKVHTGEKPYPCHKCAKTYTTREWQQLHIRKVHNKEHIPTKPRVRKRKPPV